MKLGTQVRLPDGRVGTVVFNGLCGVGIKWGEHDPDPADFIGSNGNTVGTEMPEDWPWEPDALLRDPWPSCTSMGFEAAACVGSEFVVTRDGNNP